MNRLLNALAFAAVVVAAFVMDSNLPQRVASSQLLARVVGVVRGDSLPAVTPNGLPPQIEQATLDLATQFDQVRLERAMQRMQAAQQRPVRIDMKRMQKAQKMAELKSCKVVKLDQ